MPSKNDISSFQNLPKKDVLQKHVQKKKKPRKAKKMGRPLKPAEARETYRVNFNLTQAEGKVLADKAGFASVNVFLKHYLRNNTDLFK